MSGAEALVILGVISNVVKLVDFAGKIYEHIREYSSDAARAPKSIQALTEHLRLVLQTLKDLDNPTRTFVEREKTTIQLCVSQAEALDRVLSNLRPGGRLTKNGPGEPRWINRQIARLDSPRNALKYLLKEKEIDEFNHSLDRLLVLINLQLQARNLYVVTA